MTAKVIDASVVAAWCFREPRAPEALGLMRGFELHAPLLLAYELTSVARSKSEVQPDQADLFREALNTALRLPIRWSDVDHLAVLSLALHKGISTYDACYLHLAQALGVQISTFDQELERASK